MKNIAILMGGCGGRDGSETQESVLTMYAITRLGADYQVFAPDRQSYDVVSHIDGKTVDGQHRNLLQEAGRIARSSKINNLSKLIVSNFDGVIIPGGLGTAKNLFTFALDGINMRVKSDIEPIIREFHAQGKPIGAICIAPMMLAALFQHCDLTITLGPESPWCARLRSKMGVNIITTEPDGVAVDIKNKIFTTPAYMYDDSSILQVGNGIYNMVCKMLEQGDDH